MSEKKYNLGEKKQAFFGENKGTVLIVTIWIVLVLASLVIVFAQYMRVEAIAAANHISAMKAELIADGAISYVIVTESASTESDISYGANPYEAMPVGDGYFWVLRANLSDDKNYDYGVTDEAGKINLNSANQETLLRLPGMTSELASSIIDWRDEDQDITAGGAESEYYLLLEDPYYCKDAPLETIEEVLLIKGAEHDYLYGEDLNRNGILDPGENDAEKSPPSDNSNGVLDPGFFNYVTVGTYEMNTTKDGEERINVSSFNRNQSEISDIIEEVVGDDYIEIMDNLRLKEGDFENVLEFYYYSKMEYDDFAQIIDRFTTSDRERLEGLINVNTASEPVLLCLPGLDQSDVDALVQYRSQSGADLSTILWVTEALDDQQKAIGIGSAITTKSLQYSADIIAVSGDGRAFRRYLVMVDNAGEEPKIIYKQPLHHLGWPLDATILENLRNGEGIQ